MDQIQINSDMIAGPQQNWVFRFDDMFGALEQLTQLLRDENALLAKFKVEEISELQERKSQLAWLVELQKEYLLKNPELLSGIEDEMRNKIRDRGALLEHALVENHQRLSTARLINQKVVEAVTAVMSDQLGSASGYNASGDRGLVIGKDRKGAGGLTLNKAV